jgi:hypothetical protein
VISFFAARGPCNTGLPLSRDDSYTAPGWAFRRNADGPESPEVMKFIIGCINLESPVGNMNHVMLPDKGQKRNWTTNLYMQFPAFKVILAKQMCVHEVTFQFV